MSNEDKLINSEDSLPPVFNSWKKLYALVFMSLVFMVILFYLFTKAFE